MNLIFRTYFKLKKIVILMFLVLFSPGIFYFATNAPAAIPLVTDDAGTQSKGKAQIELCAEHGHDREDGVTTKTTDVGATMSYGILDPVDLMLTIPYQFFRSKDDESTTRVDGFSDVAIEVKWRFYEKEGFSVAVKPGLTLPTGNEDRDLGCGRATYYLYLIGSKEIKPWAFHVNFAYMRNDNKGDDRKDLWHASLASTVDVTKNLKLVGDIGAETNPDRSSNTLPAYILGGFIYSPKENFDIGLGVKGGLTKPETDISVRGGITWRF
ncbi:MAG: hypothetical protein A4E63_02637 [Syntrophorhabdus sp. PtaU1.Bin050]|nr:MAG: hypothetical protein A4E63_02637 [Syntrophorhabdus sp. PtaU1.Bin050]